MPTLSRDQIAAGLTLLALQLREQTDDAPAGWAPHEWAYVKGVASAEVLRLRDQLVPAAS